MILHVRGINNARRQILKFIPKKLEMQFCQNGKSTKSDNMTIIA